MFISNDYWVSSAPSFTETVSFQMYFNSTISDSTKLLKPVLVFAFAIAAALTGLTQITQHRSHPIDVYVGFLIGAFIAAYLVRSDPVRFLIITHTPFAIHVTFKHMNRALTNEVKKLDAILSGFSGNWAFKKIQTELSWCRNCVQSDCVIHSLCCRSNCPAVVSLCFRCRDNYICMKQESNGESQSSRKRKTAPDSLEESDLYLTNML